MGYIGEFDQAVLRIVERLPASLHGFMGFITNAGSPIVCILVLVAMLVRAHLQKQHKLVAAWLMLLAAMPLSVLLKEFTQRVRPDTAYSQAMLIKSYSFPSTHAYSSFLVCGLLAYLVWRGVKGNNRWAIIISLLSIVFLIGLSRVYLGAHFPSDIVGGWILGAMVLFAVVKISRPLGSTKK